MLTIYALINNTKKWLFLAKRGGLPKADKIIDKYQLIQALDNITRNDEYVYESNLLLVITDILSMAIDAIKEIIEKNNLKYYAENKLKIIEANNEVLIEITKKSNKKIIKNRQEETYNIICFFLIEIRRYTQNEAKKIEQHKLTLKKIINDLNSP